MRSSKPPRKRRAVACGRWLEKQVERLLALPAAQDSLKKTLMVVGISANIFGTVKDPELFPEYGPLLQASMFRETELFVRALLWTRKAPLPELLSSRRSFVDTPLAASTAPLHRQTDEFWR